MAAHNLPTPPTPLIGREDEVRAVCHLLRQEDVRLLTISGPPGIGKTRLALAAAAALAGDFTSGFADGVYFVDLAPVTDGGLVLPTLLYALGARPDADRPAGAALGSFLAHKRVLLVLDNFEQVIEAAPALLPLLATAPHVKLLVTSRELLRVSGEHQYPLLPLALPPVLADAGSPRTLAALSPERLGGYAAVQLFVGRAAALRPDFALTPENALIVAGICCRLDGLPLAIELAAARVRHLTAQDIYERLEGRLEGGLEGRLHLLTGGPRDLPLRQRTLRSTVAWSYNLLDAGERLLLARLAVFRGGCSLAAAEAVCGEGLPLPVLDGLASLVDKSLVQRQETADGGARFRLLELIHEYAREQLAGFADGGEWEALRRRHAAYFAALAERAEVELRRAEQKVWFHLLDTEIDNLRAALEWSLADGGITAAVQIMSGSLLYWHIYGRQSEGIRWAELLLARLAELPPVYRIRLLRSAASLFAYHDTAAAQQLSRQALHSARLLGDKQELAWALYTVGILGSSAPDSAPESAPDSAGDEAVDESAAALAAAQVLFEELNDERGLAQVLNNIGEQARLHGDDAQAARAYGASLALFERMGDRRAQYSLLYNLAFVAQHTGDHAEAIRLLRRSLALCQELGVPAEVARELLALAGSLGAGGDPAGAARLFGAADAFLQQSGALLDPNDQPEHDRNLSFVRAALGEALFAAASAEGQAMTLEAAAAYALAASGEQAGEPADKEPADQTLAGREAALRDLLTRREREVARLIAQGLSNREIAALLVVTERTVEGHVGNILAKLDFRSRAQVAAWYVRG